MAAGVCVVAFGSYRTSRPAFHGAPVSDDVVAGAGCGRCSIGETNMLLAILIDSSAGVSRVAESECEVGISVSQGCCDSW